MLLKKIKDMGFKVKLDTNGTFPDKLDSIIKKGLVDYVAMDIKNSEDKYAETVGCDNFDVSPVKRSIEIIIKSSVPHEFRTTVVHPLHTVESIAAAAEMIIGCDAYFLQGFVDSGNLIGQNVSAVDKENMERMRVAAAASVANTSIRGV